MTEPEARQDVLVIKHYGPSDVPTIFPLVKEELERAINISGGRYSIPQTLHELLIGKLTLWVVWDDEDPIAAWVLRIIDYPGRRTMYGDLLGGNRMAEWAGMMDAVVIDWAQKFKCTHIEIGGRDGWIRYAKPFGYEKAYWVIEKEVPAKEGETFEDTASVTVE